MFLFYLKQTHGNAKQYGNKTSAVIYSADAGGNFKDPGNFFFIEASWEAKRMINAGCVLTVLSYLVNISNLILPAQQN